MSRISHLTLLAVLTLVIGTSACDCGPQSITDPPITKETRSPSLPATMYAYANPPLPQYLNAPPIAAQDNMPASNPVTDAGATLGRVLFYETAMSQNKTLSCSSCHMQAKGFSDGKDFSDGFDGGKTARSAMALTDARYYANGHFFWDQRANTLEDQVLMPIQSDVEMGMTLDEVVDRLNELSYYPALFTAAFGTADVTSERISEALAQFVRSMVSFHTKYDEGRATQPPGPPTGADFPNFTAAENRGKTIFFTPQLGSCAACHGTDSFAAPGPRNNGLDIGDGDQGIGAITGNSNENGLFKVGSLRNVALTAPYMHDGRFKTLEEVVEHYNSGVQAHPNLSQPLRDGPNGPPRRLNLSQADKDALVAFLNTLTDQTLVTDDKFSDPFPPNP